MFSSAIRFRKTLVILWVLVVVVFSSGIAKFLFSEHSVVDNSVSIWFKRDDPALVDYEKYNRIFGEQEWSILLVETDDIYDVDFLKELSDLGHRLARLDHVNQVVSIANVRDSVREKDGVDYDVIFDEELAERNPERALAVFRSRLNNNPIFSDNLYRAGDDQHTALLIQNANYINAKDTYRISLTDDIRSLTQSYETITASHLAGTTTMNAELNKSALRDVFVFYSLITLMLVAFGFCVLKTIRDVLVMLTVVIAALVSSMGALAWSSVPYNMITVMLPTCLVALAVASVIHVIGDFHEHHRSMTAEEAAMATCKQLWFPSFWTAVTTVVGFLSLALSSVLPVWQLGVYTSLGLVIAWLSSIYVAPALLTLFWNHSHALPKTDGIRNDWSLRIVGIHRLYPKTIIAILVLLLSGVSGLSELEVDTDYSKFFSSSHNLSVAYTSFRDAGYAQNPVAVTFEYSSDSGYTNDRYFSSMLQFEDALEQEAEVKKLLSVSALLKQFDTAFNGVDTDFSNYNQEQLDQLLLMAQLAGNDDIDDFVNSDANTIQMILLTDFMSSQQLDAFKDKVESLRDRYLPAALKMNITGTTVLWANMDKQVSETQIKSLVLVAAFLAVLLPVIFRSLSFGLLALTVNTLPLAITLGLMGLLDIKINMATALIGGLTLGIVVDDTIHLITRLKYYLDKGFSLVEAVDRGLESIGLSLVKTTVVLVACFSTMATSNFMPSFYFGVFISISIVIALFFDVMVLPILLKYVGRTMVRAHRQKMRTVYPRVSRQS